MDAYEPGSTYKLITAAAALESRKVSLTSRFPAHDRLEVGGQTIHNAEDGFMAGTGGGETLEQIVEYSHNVGAAEVGLSIGAKTLYAMERKAGFGSPTGVGLPGENPGIVPPPSQWSGSSLATMSFGQGVSVTPLAMARYYCAIANGGLLDAAPHRAGRLRPAGEPLAAIFRRSSFVASSPNAPRPNCVRSCAPSFLHGTGDPTAQIPGYATAGKTGTAQMVVDGLLPVRLLRRIVHRNGPVPARALPYLRQSRTPDRLVLRKRRRRSGFRRNRPCSNAARWSSAEHRRRNPWPLSRTSRWRRC